MAMDDATVLLVTMLTTEIALITVRDLYEGHYHVPGDQSTCLVRRHSNVRRQLSKRRNWLGTPPDQRAEDDSAHEYASTWGRLHTLWKDSRPVRRGSAAYRYLTETRGIPEPAGGWGGDFRSTSEGDLLVVAWDNDGRLAGGQLVKLEDRDGTVVKGTFAELGGKAKKSMGRPSRGVATLPGVRPSVVVIAEGPETGASLHAATGYTTLVMLGGMPNVERALEQLAKVERETAVIVLALDDDALADDYEAEVVDGEIVEVANAKMQRSNSTKLFRSLLSRGWDVRRVYPWPVRRYDKSDFNDALRERGAEYLSERVDAFCVGSPRSETISKLKGLEETDRALVDAFARIEHEITSRNVLGYAVDDRIRAAVATGVGAGKTELANSLALSVQRSYQRVMGDYTEMGRFASVGVAVPENTLGDEQFHRLTAKIEEHNAANPDLRPLTLGAYRGQGARDPLGRPMCELYETIKPLLMAKASRKKICASCPKRESCPFILQQSERHDIWLMATAVLYMEHLPKAFKDTTFHTLIADESNIRQTIEDEQRITADDIVDEVKCPVKQWGVSRSTPEQVANVQEIEDGLRRARGLLADLMRSWAVGHNPTPSEFIDAGLTQEAVSAALNAEWGRIIDLSSDFDVENFDVSRYKPNETADVLIDIWTTILRLVSQERPEPFEPWPLGKPTGWLEAVKISVRGKTIEARHVAKVEEEVAEDNSASDEGVTTGGGGLAATVRAKKAAQRRVDRRNVVMEATPGVIVRSGRRLHGAFRNADIINLNATFIAELEQLAIEGLEAVAETISYSENFHVFQVIDNPVSKAESKNVATRLATIAATNVLALRTGKHGVLAGSVDFTNWARVFAPPAVEAANFGRIVGNDRWRDGFVVCHAHNLPPASAAEDAIMAKTGDVIQRSRYVGADVERLIRARDGSIVSRLETGIRHPHALADAFCRLVDVFELIQLLMRTRAMRLASVGNPHYALFATAAPINYPVTGLPWWNYKNPPHWARQLAVDGVILRNREDAGKLYPANMLDVDPDGNPLPAGERENWLALPDVEISLLAYPEWPFNAQAYADGVDKSARLPGAPTPLDVMARFSYRLGTTTGQAREGWALPGLLMVENGVGGLVVSDARAAAFSAQLGCELGAEVTMFKVTPPKAGSTALMVVKSEQRRGRFSGEAGGDQIAKEAPSVGERFDRIVGTVLDRLRPTPAFGAVVEAQLWFDTSAGGAQAVLVVASGLDKLSVSRAVRRLPAQDVEVLRRLSARPTHLLKTPRAELAVSADNPAALGLIENIVRRSGGKITAIRYSKDHRLAA